MLLKFCRITIACALVMLITAPSIGAGEMTTAPSIEWKSIPLAGRKIVHGNLGGRGQIALNKFRQACPLEMPVVELSAYDPQRDRPALLIGSLEELAALLGPRAESIRGELKDEKAWREEQGYLLRYFPKDDLLLATSLGEMGLVYAISHLQRSLIETPSPAIALEDLSMLEKPETEERGIYINIGYGLSCGPITPDNWHEAEWEDFIDRLLLSRATFWSFFLWTEIEHIYPDALLCDVAKNKHVFQMLRHAIEYSQSRGLRASYLFTPTNIPAEVLARHPDWKTTIEYINHAGICSRVPQAYEMAKIVHRYQMDFFREANEYDIAFYDPGGCMCEECRKGDAQLEELLKQARDFSAFTREIQPEARFGLWTWAVWRYERIHNYSLQGKLIPRLAELLKGHESQTVIIDSFHGDLGSIPYFAEAKQHGFRTSNFVYQTNIEDGHVFLLPLLDFQQKWAKMTQEQSLDEAFLMIMEVASKYPMAHFGAEFFWDANLKKEDAAQRYALQIAGDAGLSIELRDAFLLLDQITYEGAGGMPNPVASAAAMRERFQKVHDALTGQRQEKMRFLLTTAKAYEQLILAGASSESQNTEAIASCRKAFLEITGKDALFRFFSETQGEAFFERMTGWVKNGFRQGYF